MGGARAGQSGTCRVRGLISCDKHRVFDLFFINWPRSFLGSKTNLAWFMKYPHADVPRSVADSSITVQIETRGGAALAGLSFLWNYDLLRSGDLDKEVDAVGQGGGDFTQVATNLLRAAHTVLHPVAMEATGAGVNGCGQLQAGRGGFHTNGGCFSARVIVVNCCVLY